MVEKALRTSVKYGGKHIWYFIATAVSSADMCAMDAFRRYSVLPNTKTPAAHVYTSHALYTTR